MNETQALRRYLLEATTALSQGRLPGRDQLRTNAIGIHVAWAWATAKLRGPRSNVHVYASSHRCRRGSHWDSVENSVVASGAKIHKYEFLTDIYIERWDAKRRLSHPLLVAEVEASPNQSAGYEYDGDLRSDYLCDFVKVLYTSAPKRLFLACTPTHLLDDLEATLCRAVKESPSLAAFPGGALLGVILLPAATTRWNDVRIGTTSTGPLSFDRLSEGPSAP